MTRVRAIPTRRAAGYALTLVLLSVSTLGAFYEWGGPGRRGVRQLKKGEDAAAVHSFDEARGEQPASAAVRYDQGIAFRKLGLGDSARAAFGDATKLEGAPARSAAAYNLGNEALRKNQLDDAIEAYKASLRADPRRTDAKKNLEEALRRMRQAQPPPTPPQKGGSGSKGPSGPGNGGGGGGGNQQPSPPSQGNPQAPQPSAKGPIPSKSDAELWLDALESERRSERQREKQQAEPRQENRRDW